VFSAKESLYKCVHAHVGRFIEFGEIEVTPGVGGTLGFAAAADPAGLWLVGSVTGRYRLAGGLILTTAWLGRDPSATR
jgi:4'-phosphopantetheinyl transferase EntD